MRYFEISASPLKTVSDGPQVIEVWRDITRRREIEARLANSERLASLGFLASGVSHEINNPLASITTCLDGLCRRLNAGDGEKVPDELPEYLELIRGEVDRCRRLTERLKVLGRQPRQTRETIELSGVVRDTLALLRYEAQKTCVRIEESLTADASLVLADESQIRQVVLNVVLNAMQAIDGAGVLRVHVGPASDGFVEFEVTDTGRGIEPADQRKIFEPFYSARPDGKGTGLGLFISKIIVDNLGGSIRVTSAPGSGTSFTILFPTVPIPAAAEVES
jgi:signal transduction histidine kinase